MENITDLIKTYVLIIDPTLTDDDFLDFCIGDVIDRALAYTNREQLVAQYEEDILDTSVESEDYVLPIPRPLQRALARTVVGVYKTVFESIDGDRAINAIEDNGQKVSYANEVASFMATSSDTQLFSGIKDILDKFIIPTIVENTY